MDILPEVEAPGHGEERSRASEDGDQGTGLNRTRMDKIRLEVPNEAFEIHRQSREFAPRKRFASALPDRLIHMFRHGAAFDLSAVAFELDKVNLMSAV